MDVFEKMYLKLYHIKCGFVYKENYNWVLGYEIMHELETVGKIKIKKTVASKLFGIEIEIDHLNPRTIKLVEDITSSVI